jgi:hypothetical protein
VAQLSPNLCHHILKGTPPHTHIYKHTPNRDHTDILFLLPLNELRGALRPLELRGSFQQSVPK